jgi:hypothetical protein
MDARLGDIIDDYCVKCKRLMNHAIVSILDGKAAKVRCRTCYNDHDYRHEQPPPPKIDARKLAKEAALAAAAPAEAVAVAEDGAVVEEAAAPKAKAKARGRK